MSRLSKRVASRYLANQEPISLEMIMGQNRFSRNEIEVLEFYLRNSKRKGKDWLKDMLKDWKAFATRNRRYYEGTDLEEYYLDYKRRRIDFKKVYQALVKLHELI